MCSLGTTGHRSLLFSRACRDSPYTCSINDRIVHVARVAFSESQVVLLHESWSALIIPETSMRHAQLIHVAERTKQIAPDIV